MTKLSVWSREALYRQAMTQLENDRGMPEILEDFEGRMARRGRKRLAGTVNGIARAMKNGMTFADALGDGLPHEERQILKAGESAGNLGESMGLLLSLRELTWDIRMAFAAALFAPVVYLISLWACLAIIGWGVVPKFESVMPASKWAGMAKAMYYMGLAATSWISAAVLVVFGAYAAFVLIRRNGWTSKPRAFFDRHVFPFGVLRDLNGFVWMMTYAALLRAELPETNALATQIEAGSPYMKSRLAPVLLRMRNGLSLADSFREAKLGFPSDDLVDEIGAYEGAKQFPEKLAKVGTQYAATLKRQLAFKAGLTGAVFGGLVLLAIVVVQLGANDLQGQIMNSVSSRGR